MKKILVIEDEPKLLLLLQRILEGCGYSVATAANGEEGLKIFREMQPELVITDILMPNVDGIDVIRKLRRESGTQKIIAMSGGSSHISTNFTQKMASAFGVQHFLSKPFSNQEVILLVEATIGKITESPGLMKAAFS
jgi:CheY-like chemotaxis protein